MDNSARVKKIEHNLKKAFTPSHLEVTDDSHLHEGHEGAMTGKGHFTVHITSQDFTGLSKLQAHQMIYHALGDMMQTDIHALSIKIRE